MKVKCPRCKIMYEKEFSALSRRDNKTRICSQCGTEEALEDFVGRGGSIGESYVEKLSRENIQKLKRRYK